MTTPQIIAHRGASYLAPENTLVAFRKAMEIASEICVYTNDHITVEEV